MRQGEVMTLVDVERDEHRLVLGFMDDAGYIAEVVIYRGRYNEVSRSYETDATRAVFAERMVQFFLGTSVDTAEDAIGKVVPVFRYDGYNLLYDKDGDG